MYNDVKVEPGDVEWLFANQKSIIEGSIDELLQEMEKEEN